MLVLLAVADLELMTMVAVQFLAKLALEAIAEDDGRLGQRPCLQMTKPGKRSGRSWLSDIEYFGKSLKLLHNSNVEWELHYNACTFG
ncbi:hypothetical protein QQP08_008425 [Theobroma cacao]|nr:hypothetical protein QQP08_008425 [Theobroma cacao]